jgi:hypothetical protein
MKRFITPRRLASHILVRFLDTFVRIKKLACLTPGMILRDGQISRSLTRGPKCNRNLPHDMTFHAPLRMRKHSMQLMLLMRPLQVLDVMNTVCIEHVVRRLTLPRKRNPSYSSAAQKRQRMTDASLPPPRGSVPRLGQP